MIFPSIFCVNLGIHVYFVFVCHIEAAVVVFNFKKNITFFTIHVLTDFN